MMSGAGNWNYPAGVDDSDFWEDEDIFDDEEEYEPLDAFDEQCWAEERDFMYE